MVYSNNCLMPEPPPQLDPRKKPPPIAVAIEWVTKITTVALEMVLPGIFGSWLDNRLGTGFCTIVGFGLGMTVGMYHLIVLTRPTKRTRRPGPHGGPPSES